MDDVTYASAIVEGLSPAQRPDGFARLYVALLRELVKGIPVSPLALARLLEQSVDNVTAILAQAPNTEYDEHGSIIGYGITLRQTPHAFEVEGRRLYTWCALDALMFPTLIGKPARVNSRCAETGASISLTANPHELRDVVPLDAAVSLTVPQTDIRQSFCCHVHFFASRSAANRWVSRCPGTEAVSIEAAFVLGQEVVRKLTHAAELGVA